MHPELRAFHAHNERARRLNTEAGEELARLAELGPAAYLDALAEDDRQAHYDEEETTLTLSLT